MAFFDVFGVIAVLMHGPILSHCAQMDCGAGVSLCGVLTLESGLGKGVYHSKRAGVHGLWPETGSYGTSKCIAPKDSTPPSKVYDCYGTGEGGHDHTLWFETHEWTKHGRCAGVEDADDFFSQVCALAQSPVQLLEKAKEAGADLDTMTQALKASGYPVWTVDEVDDQVLLSACAGNDGRWVLSTPSEMPSKCGGKSPVPGPFPPSPSPPSPTPPSQGSCIPHKRGPPCASNGDCSDLDGCIRCAHSGYCTDVPIQVRHSRGRHTRRPSPSPPGQGSCIPHKRGPPCSNDGDCTDLGGCIRCAHSGHCTDVPIVV